MAWMTITPYLAVIGLFTYFLTQDMFANPGFRLFWGTLCFLLVISDLVFRFIQSRSGITDSQRGLRYATGGTALLALLLNFIRNYFELAPVTGLVEETTFIPRLRDILLVLIVISSFSFIALTIVLEVSHSSVQSQSSLKTQKNSLILNTLISFLWISPLLIAVNYVSVIRNYNFDLSAKGKFSFSPTSRQIIRELKKDIHVTAFYPRPLEAINKEETQNLSYVRPEVEIILEQLKALSPHITLKFINAEMEKELMGDYPNVSNGVILIRSLKAVQDTNNPYMEERLMVQDKKDLEDLERKLMQSIINVSLPQKKVYFTSANGERYGVAFQKLADEQITRFSNALQFYNYSVSELGFEQGWPEKFPADADTILIIGPSIPFSETARTHILNYMRSKGKLFITIDPNGKEDFSWLLEKAGVSLQKGNLRQNETRIEILANKLEGHPITDMIPNKDVGVLFLANAYFNLEEKKPHSEFNARAILSSGFSSFVDANKNGKMDKDEKTNNHPLGIILTIPKEDRETHSVKLEISNAPVSRTFIYSGTSWVTNKYVMYNLNGILALNSVNWLNQSILTEKILTKKDDVEMVSISPNQKLLIWAVCLFVFPSLITISLSLFVIARRRKSKS